MQGRPPHQRSRVQDPEIHCNVLLLLQGGSPHVGHSAVRKSDYAALLPSFNPFQFHHGVTALPNTSRNCFHQLFALVSPYWLFIGQSDGELTVTVGIGLYYTAAELYFDGEVARGVMLYDSINSASFAPPGTPQAKLDAGVCAPFALACL